MSLFDSPCRGLLYGQDKLSTRCAERPLEFSEYAHMNNFHGNASVLKRYAGWPEVQSLPFAVEHAIPYDLTTPYAYDLECGLPLYLAVHEDSAALYRQGPFERVVPIGHSFLYAMDLFERLHSASVPERQGTLVFPDKSTLLMDTDFDRAAFASRLKTLPEEFQPVVVCLYWKDYQRGAHRPFIDAGLPVVSCGHVLDGDFQLRLFDLCRRFRYSCANDIAGSWTLSVLSGCHFFYLDGGRLIQKKYGKTEIYSRDPTLEKRDKQELLSLSPFPPTSQEAQLTAARRHAGWTYKKSPEDLRGLADSARASLQVRPAWNDIQMGNPSESRRLFHFLPCGVDADGWIGENASWTVPAARSGESVTFFFKMLDRGTVLVIAGSDGYRKVLRAGADRTCVVSLPQRPVEVSYEIGASRCRQISASDARNRSCRIISVRYSSR